MSVPYWARKGARVVCINASWRRGRTMGLVDWLRWQFVGMPIVGGVYTITDTAKHAPTGDGAICLKGWGTLGFHVDYFRPLILEDDEIEAKFYRTRKQQKTQGIPHFGPVS